MFNNSNWIDFTYTCVYTENKNQDVVYEIIQQFQYELDDVYSGSRLKINSGKV